MRLHLSIVMALSGCPGPNGPDGGQPDAGFGPDGCGAGAERRDASIGIPCNPVDGVGCGEGRICAYDYTIDQGSCRCPADTVRARGERCDPELQDCAAGLTCLRFTGDPTPVCYQVCATSSPTDCDALSTPDNVSACAIFGRPDQTPTEKFGVCLNLGQPCEPLADTCPADQTCSFQTTTVFTCEPAGDVPLGEDCTSGGCQRGGLCLTLTDQNGMSLGTRCYAPCGASAPCAAGACTDVGVESFGLCL